MAVPGLPVTIPIRARIGSAALCATVALLAPVGASALTTPPIDMPVPAGLAPRLSQDLRVMNEDPARQIDIQLALRLRNRGQLDDLVRRINTPGSPDHGRYLTPAEFSGRFAPTASDVSEAEAFLRSGGLLVTAASGGSTLVDARGTIAAVEAALHTRIGHYRDPAGHEFYANDTSPSVPSSIAPLLAGVVGLDNRSTYHHSAALPRAIGGNPPYSPSQVRAAYRFTAAPLASLTGAGQSMGLLELDDYQQGNLDAYSSTYSLPGLTPTLYAVDGGPARTNGGEVEVELDIEVMHAVAPGAAVSVFEAPNLGNVVPLNDAYSCMVNPNLSTAAGPCPNKGHPLTMTNSTSWGLCETSQGSTESTALDQIFVQAASQGQTFYAASGDSGAHDCTLPSGTVDPSLSVDSPASDPYVTGVGGTRLLLNANDSYKSEVAWPPSAQNPNSGSGGGMSINWARPSWQTGPGVQTSPGTTRQVPDLALDADPATGYSIYSCASQPNPATCGPGWMDVGGTSAGAPAWAAFTAIYNQYAATQARPDLGFANPILYELSACPPGLTPFNDITVGDNFAGMSTGSRAGPGYDMVTGLGTLRAAELAQALAGPGSALHLNAVSPSSGSSSGGTSVTLTGCGFVDGASVMIDGSTPASGARVVNSGTITATMPAHSPASVTLTVANPTGPPSNGQTFTYAVPVLVAAVGTDNAPYFQQDRGGWGSMGGALIAAPAVVSVPSGNVGSALFIGLGTDHDLYARTTSHGWQKLDASPVYCNDSPAATLSGGVLTVACEGADHGLYRVQQGGISADTPPVLHSTWSSLGGYITAGPAASTVPGRGVDIMVVGTSNNVHEFYAGAYHPSGFACIGHPALGQNPAASMAYVACHAPDGTLWVAQNDGSTSGGNWFNGFSLGGGLVDGPGIAVTDLGPTFYVEGLDSTPYERTLGSPYISDGGAIKFGAGASALP